MDGFLSIAEVKVEQNHPGLGISPMMLAAGSESRLLLTEDCPLVTVTMLVDTGNATTVVPLFHLVPRTYIYVRD